VKKTLKTLKNVTWIKNMTWKNVKKT